MTLELGIGETALRRWYAMFRSNLTTIGTTPTETDRPIRAAIVSAAARKSIALMFCKRS